MRNIFLIFIFILSSWLCLAQNVRYDAPFPSISSVGSTPYLIANVPPLSPTLAVCHNPANNLPCTNYATTFTGAGVACPNGAQDTPQPSALITPCQATGDARGNIGFWAPAGTYDYTVCVGTSCFGPYTVQLIASGGGGGGVPTGVANGSALVSNGVSQPPVYQVKPFLDVRDAGMDCTGVLDAFSAWSTSVVAGTSVFLPQGCILKIASSLTIPSTVTIQFSQGSQFAPTSGVTIIVNASVLAQDRQQIVNTANGTVSFYGAKEIPCGWYGSKQDLVSDDAVGCQAAHEANQGKNVYLIPINPHCNAGTGGGGCVTAGPDAQFLSQLKLHHNGSGFKIATNHRWGDSGAWISVPNALGVPAIWLSPNCSSCVLEHVYLKGPNANGWNQGDITTWENPVALGMDGFDNDGIVMSGGHQRLYDVGVQNFLRHGVFVCGNATCNDTNPTANAAADYWNIDSAFMDSNRGFGYFVVGGDGGGGKCNDCQGFFNGFGAIGDWVGAGGGANLWSSPGDEDSSRDIILAGTTQAVSSVSVSAGTCTLTTTAALANNINVVKTWVVVAGTSGGTNFNGTFRVATVNSGAQQITYSCNSTGGPASGGTVGTQSGRGVWNYLATVYASNTVPITPGYSYTSGAGNTTILNAFSEPAPMLFGSSNTVYMFGKNSVATIAANQQNTTMVSGSNGFQLTVPSTPGSSNFTIFGLQDAAMKLFLQGGLTADQETDICFDQKPPSGIGSYGTCLWTVGSFVGSRYFRINQQGGGSYFIADSSTGILSLNANGNSGSVIFEDTNLGQIGTSGTVSFFGGTGGEQMKISPGGTIGRYNSVLTTGPGVAAEYATQSQKSETGADTTFIQFTPVASAGTYRLSMIISVSAANAATLGWTATWKDSNGNAQTPTNLALFQSGAAPSALTFTTSVAGNYYADAIVDIDNSATQIVMKFTFSGTSIAAKVTGTIERLN